MKAITKSVAFHFVNTVLDFMARSEVLKVLLGVCIFHGLLYGMLWLYFKGKLIKIIRQNSGHRLHELFFCVFLAFVFDRLKQYLRKRKYLRTLL